MATLTFETFTTELFQKAKLIQTSHSVIPRHKIPYINRALIDEHYFVFQDQMVDLAATINQINKIRIACKQGLAQLFEPQELKYPTAVRFLATVLFGYGECGELAAQAALEVILKTDYLFKMIVVSQDGAWAHGQNHAFLVVSKEASDIEMISGFDQDSVQRLCELKSSYILDTYLGVFVRSVDVDRGDFGKYLKTYHFKKISVVSVLPDEKKELQAVVEQSLKLKGYIEHKKLVPSSDCELFASVIRIHMETIIKKLVFFLPETKGLWKGESGQKLKIFIDNELEKLTALRLFFKQKTIHHVLTDLEGSKSFRLTLENPKISLLL